MYIFKTKSEPDTINCRTRRVGAVIPVSGREMYYCGIDNAECRYAMQLGWDYICKHPDNASFCAPEGGEEGMVEANKANSFSAEENLRQ
jgi:hypothetical protein